MRAEGEGRTNHELVKLAGFREYLSRGLLLGLVKLTAGDGRLACVFRLTRRYVTPYSTVCCEAHRRRTFVSRRQ